MSRILVADQDPQLAKFYARFLGGHGYEVQIARGGLECLAMLRREKSEALVLDKELPWGDGAGVLACLREDGLPLPVVLTSWETRAEDVYRLIVPPVVVCLRKFFPLSALLKGIDIALKSTDLSSHPTLRVFREDSARIAPCPDDPGRC
jgi:DNA-binding response OmpR family regulator